MTPTFGNLFIAALVASGNVANLTKFGQVRPLIFLSELEVYDFVDGFAKKWGKLPDANTIKVHTKVDLLPATETLDYYHDLLLKRWIDRELKRDMIEVSSHLKNLDPLAALDVVRSCAARLGFQQQTNQISDFRDARDIVMPDYVAKHQGGDGTGVNMGWPTLDEMTGGLSPGNLVSLVGKIARGKTWLMLYACLHGWREQGLSQMFVTMEMPPLEIHQRLTALQAHIPASGIARAELTTSSLGKMKQAFSEIQGAKGPLRVIDGNFGTTIEDIVLLARQFQPDSIWIDGGYLVKHPIERDRYRRVAENAELMKRELASIAPTIVSWQFAKQSGGKTKNGSKMSEKLDLEDIAYSYAIPQVSSIVLGLFEDESVETMKSRVIEILKGRKGEVGRFRTRWDFHKMDFSEILEEPTGKLSFIEKAS